MLKFSGKTVHCLRIGNWTTRGRLSTLQRTYIAQPAATSGQPGFIHQLSDLFIPYLSPSKYAFSPLIEHYLYPVSTAPINNPTKRNLKERY